MSVPHPPDRGYDEHRARAELGRLIGSALTGIRVITLADLQMGADGRDVEADLAIELRLRAEPVALFHWAVNFRVEQLCVWRLPLEVVWPQHRAAPQYDLPSSWPGWPGGRIVAADGFKLRPSEAGLHRVDLRFEAGGIRIRTGGLSGDDATSLLLAPLDGRCQRVVWHHDAPDEPVVLWSEIGDDGYERRKVDEYRDGRLDRADATTSTGTTVLGDQRVPPLHEIDADDEFTAVAISAEEFQRVWDRAR